jgi:HSP20 family protein
MNSTSLKTHTGLSCSGLHAIGWQISSSSYAWSPPTDVYETEASFVVRVEAAGMSRSDFGIEVKDNYLVISGVRCEPVERRTYHQMEIRFGEFNTAVEIPAGADVTKTVASYEDGFLTVILPKISPATVTIKG